MSDQGSSGGNYYDNQFNSRIDDIRSGSPPPSAPRSGGWGGRAGIGGGGVAVLICIRLMVAGCIAANNGYYSSSSGYQAPYGSESDAADVAPQSNEDFQRRQQDQIREELERQARAHKDPTPTEPAVVVGSNPPPKRKEDTGKPTKPIRPIVVPRP